MAAISPVSRPSPALSIKPAGASASRVNAKAPNSSSTVPLATSEMKVVANVPCLRAAKVATVSAEPQHRTTTIASRIPARSTVVLSTSFSTRLPSALRSPNRVSNTHQSKKSPSNPVGARVVRSGGEGLYGRPRPVPCAYICGNALTPPPPGDHQGLVIPHIIRPRPYGPSGLLSLFQAWLDAYSIPE